MSTSFYNEMRPEFGSDRFEGKFYEFLIKDASNAIYTCDRNGYLTFFNQAAVDLWGRTPDTGKDLWSGSWKMYYPDRTLMSPDEGPVAKTLKERKSFEGSRIIIERPDRSFRTVLVFPRLIVDSTGELAGVHSTLVDITDKQETEIKQAFLAAIVDSSDDAIVNKDLNSIITSWNRGAERIFGYTEMEAIGHPITMIIPPSRLHEEDMILSRIRRGDKVDHFETIRVQKSGKEIPISVTISPIKDNAGNIIGASKIARDISERLEAQRQLKEHSERLETLYELGKTISENLDSKKILQKVIDATAKITGAAFGAFFYNVIDESGQSYKLFALSGVPRDVFETFGMLRNTEVLHPTFAGHGVIRSDDITKDDRYGKNPPHFGMPEGHFPVKSYLAVPVISSAGHIIGGLFFGHPEPGIFKLSDENMVVSIASQTAIALDNARLFEEVKAYSDKKDEFIALASHELKTPLTTIVAYLQLLSERDIPDPVSFVRKCLEQVKRLQLLVEEMLDISRIEAGKLQLHPESFDLKKLVMDVIDNFRFTSKTHDIVFNDPGGIFMIRADRYRMEQALINLLSNAIKYSPLADKVFVTIERNGTSAVVRIKDEGIGLTPAQQSNLFKRFYRAESASRIAGLGLGLYLTKEILSRHSGTIDVISEPGKGSEFYFSLPLD